MFCMNCGTQLADDAVFCFSCGAKVNSESQEVAVETVASQVNNVPEVEDVVTEAVEPVVNVPVEEAVAMEEVAQPTFQQPTFQEQTMYQQPTYQQPEYQQPAFQQPAFQQPMYQEQPFSGQTYVQSNPIAVKKSSKATIPAVLFALVSIVASVLVCLFGFTKKHELGMGLENIAFALTSIFVIVYAVSMSNVSSILKGVGFVAVAALHTVYYCIPAAKEASVRLSQYFKGDNNATGTDCYYGIVLIAMLVVFAIYMIMNIIRSFMNSKKTSMAMLVCGYFTMLLIVVCFIVDFASDVRGLFAFNFVPTDLGLVTLILADIFATISRAKKLED